MRQAWTKKLIAGLALVLLAISVPAIAQGETVTYQGVLRDGSGNPVANGAYAMQFRILDASTGGTELWNEGHGMVQVTGGAFSVQLGGTDLFGNLFQDNSGTQLWLEVSADTGSGMEAYNPRVPLTQMPYAASAEDAVAAASVPWAGIIGVPADLADGDDVDGGAAASVPWAGITGVPADLADGDDVDGGDADTVDGQDSTDFAAAAHTHPGSEITSSVANADAAASVPWAGITGIPADLADGDDVDGGTAASVPWAGITGVPANIADGDDVDGGTAASVPWAGVTGVPAGFADGVDNVDGGDADTVDGQHASAFAPTLHSHSASQITSGTLDISRLPVGAVAGQVAAGDHTHDASDITSGTIPTGRLNVGTAAGQVAAGNHTHSSTDYFYGHIGVETSGTKTMSQTVASGIALTNGNTRLTVSTPGLYFVSAQQLSTSGGGPAFYFHLLHNGGTAIYGYNTGSQMVDLHLGRLLVMNTGDYVSFLITNGPQVQAWGGAHSSVSMFLVK